MQNTKQINGETYVRIIHVGGCGETAFWVRHDYAAPRQAVPYEMAHYDNGHQPKPFSPVLCGNCLGIEMEMSAFLTTCTNCDVAKEEKDMTFINEKDKRELEARLMPVDAWANRVYGSCESEQQREVAKRYYKRAAKAGGKPIWQFGYEVLKMGETEKSLPFYQPYEKWLDSVRAIRPDLDIKTPVSVAQ